MSVLTTKERDGLEDVFLSIQSKKNIFNIFKLKKIYTKNSNKVAKIGDKNTKIFKFIRIFYKKKKNLSK